MSATTATEPRPLTLLEALVPVVTLILLIGLSFYLFRANAALGPNQLALIVAELVAVFIGWRRGHTLASLGEAAVASVSSGISAIFILFAVGALIGTWAMSGTLIAMVYYGLQLLSPDYFYMSSALICGIVAFSIGSSWTVVATIGIGLMGIARTVGLDPAVTAGAIVSGAYLGDKCSPLSDLVNLAVAAAGADLYTHLREILWTTVPAAVVALGLFLLMGQRGDFDASEKMEAIRGAFDISPVLFAPMVLVAVLAIMKMPPFIAIFLGALAGGLLAIIAAPARVVAFADVDGLHTGLSLFKGVLARSGQRIQILDRRPRPRCAALARRHGQHAEHDLADRDRAVLRWRGRKGWRDRAADHPDHQVRAVGRRPGCGAGRCRHRHQHRRRGPVSRHRPASPHVQTSIPGPWPGADGALAGGR